MARTVLRGETGGRMTEIATDPWASVLTLRKESLADEMDVVPGVTVGSVNIPRLLRMTDRYPSPSVSAVMPIEEDEHGAEFYY